MEVLKKYRNAIFFIILFSVLSTIYLNLLAPQNNQDIQAMKGVMDYSHTYFDEETAQQLNGEWHIYWNQLVTYETIAQAQVSTIKVPQLWKQAKASEIKEGYGYATYALKIKLPEGSKMLAIHVTSIRMAYNLFIDDQLVGSCGTVTTKLTDQNVSRNVPQTIYFSTNQEEVTMLIQVSNFFYNDGGILQSITLGSVKATNIETIKLVALDVIVIALLLVTAFYFFTLFVTIKQDDSHLYFMGFCLVYAIVIGTGNEKVFLQIFPKLSFEGTLFVRAIKSHLSILFMCLFQYHFDKRLIQKRTIGILIVIGVAYDLFGVVNPLSYWKYEMIFSTIQSVFLLVVVIKAIVISIKDFVVKKLTVEQSINTLMLVMLISANTVYIMYTNGLIETQIWGVWMCVLFIYLNMMLLVYRYASVFSELRYKNSQLLELDQLKTAFLSNTAHELTLPIQNIHNLTKSIRIKEQETVAQTTKRDLEYIEKMSMRLKLLLEDLLDIESIKMKTLKLEPKTISILSLLTPIIQIFNYYSAAKEVKIINRVQPNIFAYADENRCIQIVTNILEFQLSKLYKGTIEISQSITVETVNICFDSYYEANHAFEKRSMSVEEQIDIETMNMNIIFAAKLARNMAGDLSVVQKEVDGTNRITFSLAIPENIRHLRATEVEKEVAVENERKLKAEVLLYEPYNFGLLEDVVYLEKEMTILLVEDEEGTLRSLRQLLINEATEVIIARSGEDALKCIQKYPQIQLALIDETLMDQSGFDLCQKIRETLSVQELPVIMMIYKQRDFVFEYGLQIGINDYILKPINAAELQMRVQGQIKLQSFVRKYIDAELAFLHAQIKPHFTYNALSVITAICYEDGEKAGKLLAEFSNYLRLTFEIDYRNQMVSMEHELSLIKSYVAIEEARFGDRVKVVYHIDEEALNWHIPALTIQPLVENAIRYGILKKISGGQVEIYAYIENRQLEIRVENDGKGMTEQELSNLLNEDYKTKSVAIKNIQQRLRTLYGTELRIFSAPDEGTKISITIPKTL